MKRLILFFILPLIFFTSCKTKQKAVTDLTSDDILITMERGACFGECPLYTLKIYEGGHITFEGKRFTDKLGTYNKDLTKSEYKNLIAAFEASGFSEYKMEYESMIPDLPLITIGYKLDDQIKEVKGKESRPASLRSLQYMLEEIVAGDNWIATNPKTLSQIRAEEPPKEVTIWNEIIIKPKNGKLPGFLNEMSEHGLRLETRLSSEQNLWLLTFNEKKTDPQKMMGIIKKDPRIETAEFNKKLELREERMEEETEPEK